MEEKLKALAVEKAELENAELRAQIDVLNSEQDKNNSKIEYDKEFLRQRRIKLAEDIKETRRVNNMNAQANKGGGSDKKKPTGKAKPVKILNEKG